MRRSFPIFIRERIFCQSHDSEYEKVFLLEKCQIYLENVLEKCQNRCIFSLENARNNLEMLVRPSMVKAQMEIESCFIY